MGSKGAGISGMTNKPTSSTDKYTVFDSYEGSMKWMANTKLSNSEEWHKELITPQEKDSVYHYTGNSFNGINDDLYNKPWDEMSNDTKQMASDIYNAINKFELHHGVTLTRQCDSKIFGHAGMSAEQIRNAIISKGGVIQNDGFLSFGTNNTGVPIDSSGVIIRLRVPPSKGAMAYVNPISMHHGEIENESIVNSNSLLKFDPNSVKVVGNKVYVEADWIGQAKMQTTDPKNKSVYSKNKKKKKK